MVARAAMPDGRIRLRKRAAGRTLYALMSAIKRTLPPEKQGTLSACSDPSGVGPRLYSQRVPEGKVVKNRAHLDVRVGTGLVMLDIEGNEFCID